MEGWWIEGGENGGGNSEGEMACMPLGGAEGGILVVDFVRQYLRVTQT